MYKFLLICTFCYHISLAQIFTKQDTLRGSITPERAWWDVKNYTLNLQVFPSTKSIKGSNTIRYKVLKSSKILQIELQNPMVIDSILQDEKKLNYQKKGYCYYVNLTKKQRVKATEKIEVFYHGKPKEAVNPPWDGGFIWNKTRDGNEFIATANQSIGASIWWPCKDHPADEAESMQITITCPEHLTGVSNGKKIKTQNNSDHTTSFTWTVTNPINNYGVCINIANYTSFKESFNGINGNLSCTYYVLPQNLNRAKKHFKEVHKMLKAFEYWFGPYPFYEDGYKLVETPYLGMEHQSCIGYGNQYLKGYMGRLMGSSMWGNHFDFIIIHESGHEWFANSITCKDVADLWIHEAFTSYSEALFIEYYYGKKAGNEYLQGLKTIVKNDSPLVGVYGVNHEGSSDMYTKGSLMLHTLRQILNNDDLWRNILKGMNHDFYHQTVTGKQIQSYITKNSKLNLSKFFLQYLNTTKIPTLAIKSKKGYLYYRWENVVDDFKIPLKIYLNNKEKWITPRSQNWKKLKANIQDLKVDKNFYINVEFESF